MRHVEQGDWQNDPEYPQAPLPAHERSWRHPSEIGASQWAVNEPPLVVGRGLSVATGTVGAALALGLLWLMIPHHSRSAVSAGASTTLVREISDNSVASFAPPGGGAPTSVAVSSKPTATSAVMPVTATNGTSVSTTATTNVGRNLNPLPTMLVSASNEPASVPATAIALTPGHFVVTTAVAVNGRQSLEIMLPSSQSVVGAVVLVDKAAGTAVLSIPAEIDASVVELSPEGAQGSGMVLMAPTPMMVNVVADTSGVRLNYDRDIKPGEGSIVLDQKGRLLGICTMSASGATLVSVDAMLKALDAAATVSVPAWIGIHPDFDAGQVAVGSVVVDGPAQVSGVRAGDIIEAIDGIPIMTIAELGEVIASHAAGDSVTVRLLRTGQLAPVVINITLSSHPDSM
jgi:hypothetical protein